MANIKICDDSQFQRKVIRDALTKQNHTVTETKNGRELLIALESDKPDCIILDLLMPDMDGVEVLAELQKQKNVIPVIVLTADVQQTTYDNCIRLGASAFLNKPVNGAILAETVLKMLGTEG